MLTVIAISQQLDLVNSIIPENLHFAVARSLSPSGDLDAITGLLSLSSISLALGEIATSHGRELGIYNGFDPRRDCGWVVLSARLRLLQPVPTGKELKLETWVAHIENGQLMREYRISDSGQTLVEASHAFVLFDRQSRRIVIPPREQRDKFRGRQPAFQFHLNLSRRTLRPIESRDDFVTDHTVSGTDIDQNNHLNNSIYLKWIEAHLGRFGLSLSDRLGFQPFEFGIEFLAEANFEEKIQIRTTLADRKTYFLSETTGFNVLAASEAAVLSSV